ncbi:hypothetical protein KXD93_26500 [Mucilaginibacter sp. BJC16-A38]|uniref:hypothetical protein n=1 Tax=Mucilaginibacter phenanthrenivorans TaxID=1234842 RepID=UPI0021584596|nr:hypothetical protein [Mucilaginibacter phenanthrenivorans]MCR8561231.1 hypothetical protein [Mucilaginibacter phenanthrenivorans]
MPEFISKLQHKTYEKGEFSDEKVRTLDETIELVKTFPWDDERTLTDIQLTGPSVTIQDEYVNYLKIGLYFNGKFCLYYLDNDNHLYEYHVIEKVDVLKIVADFFNSEIELKDFEKHIFNIGNQAHFVTNYFEYREKLWRIIMLTGFMLLYGVFFVVADASVFATNTRWYVRLPLVVLSAFYYFILGKIYCNAIINRDNYLQISKGNDVFSFGYNQQEIKTYNKMDISEIVTYEHKGSRNPNFVEAYAINFKDGSSIKFTNMLISSSAFRTKFTDGMDNPVIPFTAAKKGMLSVL